jgi:diguanylate cyclase (GGDEF)-like protein/PAS domain S-box-containing protein
LERNIAVIAPRILVAGALASVAQSLEQALTELGYTVTAVVTTGVDALAAATAQRPDLVLFDAQLATAPDGLEAAEQIRLQLALPLVYVSADDDMALIELARGAGPSSYVHPPLQPQNLQPVIELTLHNSILEQRLKENDDRYRALLGQAQEAIFLYDLETRRIIEANASFYRLLGYQASESANLTIDVVLALKPPEIDRIAQRALLEPRVDLDQLHYRRKDGTLVSVVVRASHSAYDGRATVCFIANDIERPLSALQDTQRYIIAALDAFPAHIAVLDSAGAIIAVNAAWRRFAELNGGFGDSWGVGANYLDICDSASGFCSQEASAIAAGIRAVIHGRQEDFALEYPCHSPDEQRWYIARVTRFFADQSLRIMIAHENITARKIAEADLRRAEERVTTVFRASPVAIGISSLTDGRLTDVNDSFLRLIGYRRNEALGRTMAELGLWVGPAEYTMQLERLDQHWATRELETQLRTRSGNIRDVLVSLERLDVSGEPCVLKLIHDITARKRAEADLQEANLRLTRWVHELEQRTREISILSEMGNLLKTCDSVAEAYTVAVQLAQQIFPQITGVLYVINSARTLAEAVAGWGDWSEEHRSAVMPLQGCWGLRRSRPHLVSDTRSGVTCAHLTEPLPASTFCAPLIAQGEVVGLLHLSAAFAGGLGETQQRLALAVAEQIELTVTNLMLREILRDQSIRDPLTGLFNRRYLTETLERELARARREQTPLSVMMLDIDHFKRFNDQYGHDAGDVLLQALSAFLQVQVREGDVVCRYGGEEFTLILPGASLEVTRQRAEHLRNGAKFLQVWHAGQSLGPISVSLGVATFPDHAANGETLLRMADAALYRAKTMGRDRVVAGQFDTAGEG